jgi:dihydropteroate synthase
MATRLDTRTTPAPNLAPGANVFAALLAKARPLIMGVLNVTPDSFSDGGRFLDPQAAIAHARQLAAEGADILDIGAESTRPYGGAVSVPLDDERARLAPVLPDVVALGVPVSIDTLKAAVAAWALDQGAAIVNDVWGLQRDPDMAGVVAARGAAVIIMHNRDRADPAIDIVADVTAFFERSLVIAAHAGIARERIALDPGIGFGKTVQQNFELVRRLDVLTALGRPVVVGFSRKSSLGRLLGDPQATTGSVAASVGAAVAAFERGAAILRVHDVREHVEALAAAQAALA